MLLLILSIVLIGAVLSIGSWQQISSRLRSLAQGLLVSYVTILLIFLCVEGYFRFFHAQSTAYHSLANVNWLARYWQVNEDGFRDFEWQDYDFDDKTTIAVVGDSFTAGSGINDPEDRYSNVLAQQLGDDYIVVNLGEPGSATPIQIENLQSFDYTTPDIVIWQYFLNDIEYAALRVSDLPPVGQAPDIAQQSYLLNYLYFTLSPPLVDYWGWQYTNYDNFAIWELHRDELEAMVNYVESIDAQLIVLVYPNMIDPVGSIPYVDRVEQAIQELATNDVTVIKLFDAVASWDSDVPLIVSNRDAHPSVEFNQYIGDLLYAQISLR